MRAHLQEYAWLVVFPCKFTLDKIVQLDLRFLIKDVYHYPNLLASVPPLLPRCRTRTKWEVFIDETISITANNLYLQKLGP